MFQKNQRLKKRPGQPGLPLNTSKKYRRLNLPILISIISLVVTITGIGINFWFNNKNFKKQYTEDLRITIQRNYEDYKTNIKEGIKVKYILVKFNCLIVNNSEKAVVIDNFESKFSDGLETGYGLYYKSDSVTFAELPIKIDSKESKRFEIQEYMKMDTTAFSFLKSSLPTFQSVPMSTVEYILAKKGMDIFGCKASINVNNGMIAYGDPGSLYEKESFTAEFETTNGMYKASYFYYFDPNEKW